MEIPNFLGGWSYTQKEMTELFKHIKYNENYSILEFGSGDSTNKIYNHFKKYTKNLMYYSYESNPEYMKENTPYYLKLYDINNIENTFIPDVQFDLILIDGPNGDKRSLWYSKIKNNVKIGTICLIDDFNHYKCFGEELDRNYEYELLSFSDEPFVPYGEHSWKIVRILSIKK